MFLVFNEVAKKPLLVLKKTKLIFLRNHDVTNTNNDAWNGNYFNINLELNLEF